MKEVSREIKFVPYTANFFLNLFTIDIFFAQQVSDEFELLSVDELENYVIDLKMRYDKLKSGKTKK